MMIRSPSRIGRLEGPSRPNSPTDRNRESQTVALSSFSRMADRGFDLEDRLETLETNDLKRALSPVDRVAERGYFAQPSGDELPVLEAGEALVFASNNYLGLTDDQRVQDAAPAGRRDRRHGCRREPACHRRHDGPSRSRAVARRDQAHRPRARLFPRATPRTSGRSPRSSRMSSSRMS